MLMGFDTIEINLVLYYHLPHPLVTGKKVYESLIDGGDQLDFLG